MTGSTTEGATSDETIADVSLAVAARRKAGRVQPI
jgi:hypothetical protein